MNRGKALSHAYQDFKDRLVTILYEEDPAGMGRSVGAPENEYSAEAAELIVRLKRVESREDATRIIEAMFPGAGVRLTALVWEHWLRFNQLRSG